MSAQNMTTNDLPEGFQSQSTFALPAPFAHVHVVFSPLASGGGRAHAWEFITEASIHRLSTRAETVEPLDLIGTARELWTDFFAPRTVEQPVPAAYDHAEQLRLL